MRTQVIGGNTFVFATTDAAVVTVEFSLVLTGSITLSATDFIL